MLQTELVASVQGFSQSLVLCLACLKPMGEIQVKPVSVGNPVPRYSCSALMGMSCS